MLLRLILYTLVFHIAWGSMRVTVPLYALQTGHGAGTVGILMAILSIGPALLAIHIGCWIDRAGARRPLAAGWALLMVALAIAPLLPVARFGLWPLALSCMLAGPGFILMQITTQQLVGYLSSVANRTSNFACLSIAFALSGLVSPLVSGYAIDHFGHSAAYLAAFAFCSAAGLCFFLDRRSLPDRWPSPRTRAASGRLFELFSIGPVRNVLIVGTLIATAWDLQTFIVPVYGHSIGLTATQIGWTLGMFAVGSFLVRAAMPFLSRHMTEWQVIIAAFFIDGLAYLIFPFFTALGPLMAVMFLLGCGLGSTQPNVLSLLHSETPAGRVGEAIGLRTMLLNISHTGLPLLLGAAGTAIGTTPLFWAMTALLWCGGLWTRLIRKS